MHLGLLTLDCRNARVGAASQRQCGSAVVKIKALTKSFGTHDVFRDLTLDFPRGQLSVIMGPSGCGKSTLLRCINFLEMFDSGSIAIGDLSVSWDAGQSRVPAVLARTGRTFVIIVVRHPAAAIESGESGPARHRDANASGTDLNWTVPLGNSTSTYRAAGYGTG